MDKNRFSFTLKFIFKYSKHSPAPAAARACRPCASACSPPAQPSTRCLRGAGGMAREWGSPLVPPPVPPAPPTRPDPSAPTLGPLPPPCKPPPLPQSPGRAQAALPGDGRLFWEVTPWALGDSEGVGGGGLITSDPWMGSLNRC